MFRIHKSGFQQEGNRMNLEEGNTAVVGDVNVSKNAKHKGQDGLFTRNGQTRKGLVFILIFASIGSLFVLKNFAESPYGDILTGADELVAHYDVPMTHGIKENDFPIGSPPVMTLYGDGLMLCSDHMSAHANPAVSPLALLKQRHLSDLEVSTLFDKVRALGFDNLLIRTLPKGIAPAAGETASLSLVTSTGERRVTLFDNEKSAEFDAIASYITQECAKAKDDYLPDDVQLDTIKLPEAAESVTESVPTLPITNTDKDNGIHSVRITGDEAKKLKTYVKKGNLLYKATDGKKIKVRVTPNLPVVKIPKTFIKKKDGSGLVYADANHRVRFIYVVGAEQAVPADAQTKLNDIASTLPNYYLSQTGKSFITSGIDIVRGSKTSAAYKVCESGPVCGTDPAASESLSTHRWLTKEFSQAGLNTVALYSWGADNTCRGWGGPVYTTDNVSVADYGFASYSSTTCWPEARHLLAAHEAGHGFGLVHICDHTIMDACGTNPYPGYGAPLNVNQAALLRNSSLYFNTIYTSNPVTSGTTFVSVSPARLLESRAGASTIDGLYNGIGRLAAGSITQVQIAGRAGIPGDALAAALNVTVINPQAGGYMTVYPCGIGLPGTSNINFNTGITVANAVITKLGGGNACIYTNNAVDVVVDVNGAFPNGSGAAYTNITPARILETRAGASTADGQYNGIGRLAAGSVTQLQVNGRVGIPSDASSVSLNITAINPQANGYMVLYPCDIGVPGTSTINYTAGSVISNAVISKVGNGTVCIYTNNAIDLVVDINGAFNTITSYASVAPARLLETRGGAATIDGQYNGIGRVGAGSITSLQVAGRAKVANDALATVLNVTVINPDADGYVTVFPCGSNAPGTSTVNYKAGSTVSNLVIAQLTSGKICIYANNTTDLVVDVNGAFGVSDTQQYVASATISPSTQPITSPTLTDTTAPAVPTGLKATAVATNQINVSWNASTDDTGVTGYNLARNGLIIAKLGTGLTYSDTTVQPSTSYYYQIAAFDAAGNTSDWSALYSVATPAALDTQAPTVPTNLAAKAVSSSQINLTWSASTDNTGVTGYDIYRGTGTATPLKIAAASGLSYSSTGLLASTSYTYYVVARDAAGNSSSPSANASATTSAYSKCTGITLYKDSNYTGTSQTLTVGRYDYTLLTIGNDQLSSMQVPSGCKVTLYQNGAFSGATQTLTKDWAGSASDPWNDITSGVEVMESTTITSTTPINCAGSGVTIYNSSLYGGKHKSFSNGKYDVTQLGLGDNAISSVKVATGCRVILYQNSGFSGATKVLTGNWDGSSTDPWNDQTSSIEVRNYATETVTSAELLKDNSFEQGGLGWQLTQPTGGQTFYSIKTDGTQAQSGTNYAQYSSTPYGGSVYQSVSMVPEVGATYRLTGWVKSPSCTAVYGNLNLLSLWNAENAYTSFTADCYWRQIKTYFNAKNAGNTELRPQIPLNTGGENLNIDSLSLVKVSFAE